MKVKKNINNIQFSKYYLDLKFYLIAALAGLCYSLSFGGYDIPLHISIFNLAPIFLLVFAIVTVMTVCINFSNIYKLYKNNRKTLLGIILLTLILALFAKIYWVIIVLILMLVFYPKKYNLASKYLFFWSSFLFSIVLSIGIIFPELGRESVGKASTLFGSTGSSEALSLGFANPNQPLLFLTIVAINGAFVFADSKYRRTYAMVMMALSTIIYLFTLSRTSYIALMIFLLIYFIGSIKTYKIISRTILVVLVFFTASSFIVATKYGEIGNPINDALTNRPYLWNLRVQDNAAFNLIGNKDRYEGSGAESALDNNYINLISRHGWVAYIIVFYFLLIWRKESDREYDEVYVLGLFCILVYFLSESMPFTLVLSIVPIISIQRKFLVSGENKI